MASMSTKRDSSSSASSSFTTRWTYEVFLSFRGEDTRNGFTNHLYIALKQKGIFTFRDNEKLERGKSISLELLKAIEESRFAIIILSRNYASSTWCLDELAKIIKCKIEMGMIVLPVFYNVDPSEVRKQTGTFAQAFVEHEKENKEKVQTWRAALREVANLSGWHLKDRLESEIIQNIVSELWHKLSYAISEDIEDQVGIISRAEKLESCLDIGCNDVRIIGVWGMGGIGKTTLARVVFDMVSKKFEGSCFLANVREVSEKDGLVPLQQKLIREIFNESICAQDVHDGVLVIKNRLRHKRILLVLDDVNHLDQLNKLAGKHIWFGLGSRVIITTKDRHLLQILEVDEIYDVEGLNDDEALHLLSLKAFKKVHPPKDFLKLSKDVVHYANGLPLAIGILGSSLFKRSIDQWKSTLNRLKEFPESEILQVLKIGFDGLRETEKEIFLNIACFFNHEDQDCVIEILEYLELFPKIGLSVLIEKSLIKFGDKQLWMHDLLQEMGRSIVYQECPKEPGKRSRLWLFEDINNILTNNMGTKTIQSMVLKLPSLKDTNWNPKSFSKMRHLKLLIIDNVHNQHDFKHLPSGLRFLDWSGYPSKSFPSSFQLKSFERLKFIKLIKSLKLTETPNFNNVPALEKLILEDCINLPEVHQSIGFHKKLILLNLKGCRNLRSLPRKLEMESLEIFILSGCSKIITVPEFGENMKRVSTLYLDGTAIMELPASIGQLTSLASMNLRDCKKLVCLPNTIFDLRLLKYVDISGCSKLERLPENLGNAESLEELDLSGIAIKQVPSSIGLLKNLKVLSFSGCKGLSSFELESWYDHSMPRRTDLVGLSFLSGLCSLTKLNLRCCNLRSIPNEIGYLFSLENLDLSGNSFVCLPNSLNQLSKLVWMWLNNCTSLQSLPKLPLNVEEIRANGCSSLEMLPSPLKPNDSWEPSLLLQNCIKLADNQYFFDMFIAMIKKLLQGPFSRDLNKRYDIVIPGSEIPEWFSHQSMGAEVNIKEHSHLNNEWRGIAACVVFCSHPHDKIDYHCGLSFYLIANGQMIDPAPGICKAPLILSDHLWLLYLLPQYYDDKLINLLWGGDTIGLKVTKIQIGIRIKTPVPGLRVKKCGFRMVYNKDIADLNQTMPHCSENNISPYEGLDVLQDNKVKRSYDNYNEAGPSGEGSSNDIPHPKRNERLPDYTAHGNFDCEESIDSD